MSMILFNPTDEDFEDMLFGGRGFPVKAGEKVKVEDACGKQLTNVYGMRGLCSLEFGDVEEEVAAAGRERNLAFKRKMVGQHNYRNVVRKQQGLAYTPPTKDVRRFAEELKITLDEPYAAREKEHDRLAVLEDTVRNLTQMMTVFMSKNMVEEVPVPDKEGKKESKK